jgi:hypothetical protein
VVVQAPSGAALGVTAGPGRLVDRKDQRPAHRPVGREQVPDGLGSHLPLGQRAVQAAPATPKPRLQAQLRQRAHRSGRAQQRIGELKQPIRPPAQAAIPALPEPGQQALLRLLHNDSHGHRASFRPWTVEG